MIYFQKLISSLSSLAEDNRNYWLALFFSIVLVILFFWYQINNNPNVYYLSDSNNASWILEDIPFDVVVKQYSREVKLFKKEFYLTHPVKNITLAVEAFKFFRIFIDAKFAYESDTIPAHWKKSHKIDLGELTQGSHEIVISVMNYDGPVALFAYSNDAPIKTDKSWSAKDGNGDWSAVRLATKPVSSDISSQFQPAYKKLFNSIPVGILACLIVFGFNRAPNSIKVYFNSSNLRWLLIGIWVIFAANSMFNTKMMGFDWAGHVSYIQYILLENKLPLATDGWQMFQSPLFYIICANIVKLLTIFISVEESVLLLRAIPLLCGIVLVEICYRCSRIVFNDRGDLQSIALLVGALMPMNLYMSQYFGNEPLLAVFSAAAILILFQWIKNPAMASSSNQQLLLGLLLGLALLTKVTALILVGVAFITLVCVQFRSSKPAKSIAISCVRVFIVVAAIAGWYYIRNWILLGKPFLGGWDSERGALLAWWQDPGYRYIANFTEFGQALIYPLFSATHSFWDGFYSTMWADGLLGAKGTYESRPPWNYTYVLATIWLSLVPTAGLLFSLVAPLSKKSHVTENKNILLFSNSIIFLYLVAVLLLYLKLPTYSTVKASYSLGLLPCYAIVISIGLGRFIKNEVTKFIITTFMVWWGISSCLGYFSLGIAT